MNVIKTKTPLKKLFRVLPKFHGTFVKVAKGPNNFHQAASSLSSAQWAEVE
jgi:hypothetical protein